MVVVYQLQVAGIPYLLRVLFFVFGAIFNGLVCLATSQTIDVPIDYGPYGAFRFPCSLKKKQSVDGPQIAGSNVPHFRFVADVPR